MVDFVVDGMTCGGCAASVTRAIQAVVPQATVEVDLATKKVSVQPAAEESVVRQAVEDAGFTFLGAAT